jgi:hypothetical protein
MAIRIQQPGMAELSAATGSVLGKAQKAQQQQQQEEERALIEEERAYQTQQRQAAQQWEIEKMRMRSEQDLAHEMRMRQSQLEKEARAEEWAVEKMELASRIDFEREEKSRQMQLSRLDSQIQTLQDKIDSGELSGSDLAIRNKLVWLEAQREAAYAGVTGPSYSMTAIDPPGEDVGVSPWWRGALEKDPTDLDALAAREKALEPKTPSLTSMAATAGAVTGTREMSVDLLLEMSPEEIRSAPLLQGMPDEEILKILPIPALEEKLTGVKSTEGNPFPEYPDAYQEGGVWYVLRDGKRYRIEP